MTYKGIWLGPAKNQSELPYLREILLSCQTEEEYIEIIIELLKSGDFSVKNQLIQLMNTSKDDEIVALCVRVFLMISTHDDFYKQETFNFLARASEDIVETFAVYANRSYSYEIVPYLLSLLDSWQDTNSEIVIRDGLDSLLGIYKDLGEEASLEDMGDYYLEQVQQLDSRETYYYNGQPLFLGDLSRELLTRVYRVLETQEALQLSTIPSLLSTLSGKKCPVDYFDNLTSEKLSQLYGYMDTLIQLELEPGKKYFYGHLVTEWILSWTLTKNSLNPLWFREFCCFN